MANTNVMEMTTYVTENDKNLYAYLDREDFIFEKYKIEVVRFTKILWGW